MAVGDRGVQVFYIPTFMKGERGKYQLVVSDKSWKKLKQKLKTFTRKTTPMSFDERIEKLNEVQRGWINAFRMASIQNKLTELKGWLRNRLRYCIWSRLDGRKSLNVKGKNLIRLGVEQGFRYVGRAVLGWVVGNRSESDSWYYNYS